MYIDLHFSNLNYIYNNIYNQTINQAFFTVFY